MKMPGKRRRRIDGEEGGREYLFSQRGCFHGGREGGPHGAECTRAPPAAATGREQFLSARMAEAGARLHQNTSAARRCPAAAGCGPRAQVSTTAPRRCCRCRGDAGAAPAAGGERPLAGAPGRRGPAGTTSNYRGRRRRGWGWRCRRRPRYVGAERSPRREAKRETVAKNCGGEAAPLGSLRFSTSS